MDSCLCTHHCSSTNKRNYMNQFCADTEYHLEDPPRAMTDKDKYLVIESKRNPYCELDFNLIIVMRIDNRFSFRGNQDLSIMHSFFFSVVHKSRYAVFQCLFCLFPSCWRNYPIMDSRCFFWFIFITSSILLFIPGFLDPLDISSPFFL